MRITELVWLEDIVEKLIWKHNVKQYEVVEALTNCTHFRLVEKGHRKGENVYVALCQTNSGRYLTVFFVYKVYKTSKQALIISARDMTKPERRKYEQR